MKRSLTVLDRTVVLLVGLALLAGGLALVDWRQRLVLDSYATTVRTGALQDTLATGWWPWAGAGGGIVLGLLGLWWLTAHVRRPGPGTVRLSGSAATGRLEVDLRSVADAAAQHLATLTPVADPRGRTSAQGGLTVLELRARLDVEADPAGLLDAARTSAQHVVGAFPADPVACRVVLDAPRRPRTGRRTPRVR